MGLPGGRPKGSKNKTTLDKEARRAIFDTEVSQMFIEKIKKARPEYLLDQFMGKAPDVIQGDFEVVWPKHLISESGTSGGQDSSQSNEKPNSP